MPKPDKRTIPRRRGTDCKLGWWWIFQRVLTVVSATIWNFVDNRAVVRRVAFVWVLWMTSEVIYWAMGFAGAHPEMDGLKLAAILGAVLTPWSAMQAAIFKFYSDSTNWPVGTTTNTQTSSTSSTTRGAAA